MGLKFGFEVESFCLRDDKPILVPSGLPFDECGWLVEARSEPHHNVRKAIYLLKAELEQVDLDAKKQGVTLAYTPYMEISRALRVEAARNFKKGRLAFKNVYGHATHRCSTRFATAALHVSVTNEQEFGYYDKDNKYQTRKYPGFVDHAALIALLDKSFKQEIAAAKRNPGFYEVKVDGRIEYRSLPNNVDLDKLCKVLQEFRS